MDASFNQFWCGQTLVWSREWTCWGEELIFKYMYYQNLKFKRCPKVIYCTGHILANSSFITATPSHLSPLPPLFSIKLEGRTWEWGYSSRKDSLCVLVNRFCISRKDGSGGDRWDHLQGGVHMVATRLCYKVAMAVEMGNTNAKILIFLILASLLLVSILGISSGL